MSNDPQKIKGYRDLSAEEIGVINDIKELGGHVDHLIKRIETSAVLANGVEPDARWIAISKTNLQQGFMALVRAVAKPGGF